MSDSARSYARRNARCGLIVAFLLWCVGCGPGDCLPPPDSDPTPPDIDLVIVYTDAQTGERVEETLDAGAPALRVVADPSGVVEVRYGAADPEGMRQTQLGASLQRTVAVGTQSRALDVDPLTASCPRPALEGSFTYRPEQGQAVSLGLGLVAENWAGGRSSTPTHVVRILATSGR